MDKASPIFWLIPIGIVLLALAPMGPGYYKLIRYLIPLFVGILVWMQYDTDGRLSVWVFLLAAVVILFNPIFPFYLGRNLWRVADIGTALLLAAHCLSVRKPFAKRLR